MSPNKRKRQHCEDSDDDYSPSVKKYEKVTPEAVKRPRRLSNRKKYIDEGSYSEPGSDSKVGDDSSEDSDSETGSYLKLDDESTDDSDSGSGSDSKSEDDSGEDPDSESGSDSKLEGNNIENSDSEPGSHSKLENDSNENSDSEPEKESKLEDDISGDSESEPGSDSKLKDDSSEDSESEPGSDPKLEGNNIENSDSEPGSHSKLENDSSDNSDSEPEKESKLEDDISGDSESEPGSDSKLKDDSSEDSESEPGSDPKLEGNNIENSDSEPGSHSKLENDSSDNSDSEPEKESKLEDDISGDSESQPGNDSKLKGDSSEDSESEPGSDPKLEGNSENSDSEPGCDSKSENDSSDNSDSERGNDSKLKDDSIKDSDSEPVSESKLNDDISGNFKSKLHVEDDSRRYPDWVFEETSDTLSTEDDESSRKKVKLKICVRKKKKPKRRKTNTEKRKRHSVRKMDKNKNHEKKGKTNACEMSNEKLSRNQIEEDNTVPSFSHFSPLSENVHKKNHVEKKKKLKKVARTDASNVSNEEQSDSETRNVPKENHIEEGERHATRKTEKKKKLKKVAQTDASDMSNEEQSDSETRNVPKDTRGKKRKRPSKKVDKNKKAKIDAYFENLWKKNIISKSPKKIHDKKHKVSSKAASLSNTTVASPCEVECQTLTRPGRKNIKSKFYLCRKCNISFESKSKYKTHNRNCQSQSAGGDKLDDNDHQDNEEECNDVFKFYLCRKCNISFEMKSKYKTHKWNCQSESAGGDKSDVDDHRDDEEEQCNDAVSQEQNEILECGACGDLFQDSLDILLHQRKHTKVKCKACKETFPDEATLQLHITLLECPKQYKHNKSNNNKNHTRAKGDGYFECRFCKMAFGFKEKLIRHMSGHFTQQSALSGVESAIYKRLIRARNALKDADEHKANTLNNGIADEQVQNESTDFQKQTDKKDAESDKSDVLAITTKVHDDQNSKEIDNRADTRSQSPSSTLCDKCNVEFFSADDLTEHRKRSKVPLCMYDLSC